MTKPIAVRYSARQQVAAMRQLTSERGEGWARDLPRVEFLAALEATLIARFG